MPDPDAPHAWTVAEVVAVLSGVSPPTSDAAHGWTAEPCDPGWTFIYSNGTRVTSYAGPHRSVVNAARTDLARCIEDAARYAKIVACYAECMEREGEPGWLVPLLRLLAPASGDGTLPEDDDDGPCPDCGFDTERNVLVRTDGSAEYPCGPCVWAHDSTGITGDGTP